MTLNIHPGYLALWSAAALISLTIVFNGRTPNLLIPFAIAAIITAIAIVIPDDF